MTTKSLSALVLRVLRNETTFDVPLPEILKFFRSMPVSRSHQMFATIPDLASIIGITCHRLPEGKSQAQHHNNPVLARAVLDSYFRIIADFTWQVYIYVEG